MKYENIKEGIFIERPNRFIAYVEIDGNPEKVHVKNTGRCKELHRKGVRVYLEKRCQIVPIFIILLEITIDNAQKDKRNLVDYFGARAVKLQRSDCNRL